MSPYEDLAELDLHLGERKARVLEGIDGESLVVLRLHVPVTESLAELDLLLGKRQARILNGIEGQSLESK